MTDHCSRVAPAPNASLHDIGAVYNLSRFTTEILWQPVLQQKNNYAKEHCYTVRHNQNDLQTQVIYDNKDQDKKNTRLFPEHLKIERPALTPEQKRDITGIVLILIGVLILLSTLTAESGKLTQWVSKALQTVFGWGGLYALPPDPFGIGCLVPALPHRTPPKGQSGTHHRSLTTILQPIDLV